MRLFVAIDLPDEWKQMLAQVEQSIGWLGRGVKWVAPESIHITLKFLGETEDRLLPALSNELSGAAALCLPFSMQLKGTGVFPNRNKPRVYWAGLNADAALFELQQRVEDCTIALGFETDDHPFKPHLTVARIKEPIGKDRITDALLKYKIESEPVVVKEMRLMRSHLSRAGAHYEVIRTFEFK